jgi:CubicO group peptidase (beta-lactamase class C family)
MQQWQVPGLAIVIVKDGQVVKMQGYGVRSIIGREPVDEHTAFFIASNSKLFTGTALANLEQQQKINLNDPLTKYYPDFRLYDSTTTRLVTLRDLLTHRIGTKTFQGDFTFWNTELSSQEIMQKMQLLKPVGMFRQDYGYCNSCFMAAGEVIPKVTGLSWARYVQDSILARLDMRESYSASNGIEQRVANMAVPYTTSFSGQLRPVPYDRWDNMGAAASIVSNVSDLSHWLMMQLDSGRYQGKRILPWAVLQKTRDIQIMNSSRKSTMFPTHFRGYGLGLNVADYQGRQVYWHTGGAAGMVSNVCFVPEANLGIAILTTNDNQNFFEALRYQVLDAYLGVPFVNRSQQFLPGFEKNQQKQMSDIDGWRSRDKGQTPTLPLGAYAGRYEHPLYGPIAISVTGRQLSVKFQAHKDLSAALTYLDNGEWLLEYNNIEYGIFAIKFALEGQQVKSVTIPCNDFVEIDPYIFTKR